MKQLIRYKRFIFSLSFYIFFLSLLGCKEEMISLNPFKSADVIYAKLDISNE
ncbi:hypothetical protein SAMN04488029_1047 [Reichenbachiella faecimaris]|uniref:Uncharacterized protein n=1 Tax=Reichenbachiella faecimaris TaxID=692418 RepID=A0A1W2G8S7_REIFA|nr:hypothetical protein SAMN04488029_1047 [Reichenbachiella faecimaris]